VPPALDVKDLRVRYGTRMAVDGANWTAESGAVTALLGANGAGKTSTIEAACGLTTPSGGTLRLLGGSPQDPAIRAQTGVMLQTGGLYPAARPLPWLKYLARLYPNPADPVRLLESVGIDPASKVTARRMSGGEQQRLKLAAALLPQPRVLFLDEPTAGLDAHARRELLALLRGIADDGAAIILTTHLLGDVEELSDHIVVMQAGRVVADGSLDEITGASGGLRFDGPMHLDTGSLTKALPSGYEVLERRPGSYVINGAPTPQVLASVTSWCAQHGVMATSFDVGRQSLEDFLITQSGEPA
jgi:ABC-2 type transport system ATP-binding protein